MQHPSEPDPFARGRIGNRLKALATARLERDEVLVTWTRAWVSVDGRFNVLLAARTRDFAVLTDRRLLLWSTGFFTRRPRRRVLADRLDELTVTRIPPEGGRRLVISSRGHRRLRIEVTRTVEGERFAGEVMRRVRTPETGTGASGETTVEAGGEAGAG